MRKAVIIYVSALLCAAALPSCTSDAYDPVSPEADAQVTLRLSVDSGGVDIRTKSEDGGEVPDAGAGELKHVWYVIADSRGQALDLPYHKLSDDLSCLKIEGLSYGRYICAFLATTGDAGGVSIGEPQTLSDLWLSAADSLSVIGEEFFRGSIEIEIGKSQSPVDEVVELRRCVSSVTVSMRYPSAYMRRFVRRVSVTFDSPVCSRMNADGTYAGELSVSGLDVTDGQPFLTFPAAAPMSGYVYVESVRSDGSAFNRRYRFEDCAIEAGRLTSIDIDYIHPEDEDGVIEVREEDYPCLPHIDTMWLADEEKTVMYSRSFRVNQPLVITINGNRQLQVRLYSPVPVEGVTVKAQLRSVSSETFVLAKFERLYPFMAAEFDLPLLERKCVFTTESGARIEIPAQPSLAAEDLTLIVDTGDDPYMKKIETIPYNWNIIFHHMPSYSWSVDMTPALCRHAATLAVNMAYMYATDDFDAALQKYEGQIKRNRGENQTDISLDEIRGRIKNLNGVNVLRCGNCVGYGGMCWATATMTT